MVRSVNCALPKLADLVVVPPRVAPAGLGSRLRVTWSSYKASGTIGNPLGGVVKFTSTLKLNGTFAFRPVGGLGMKSMLLARGTIAPSVTATSQRGPTSVVARVWVVLPVSSTYWARVPLREPGDATTGMR